MAYRLGGATKAGANGSFSYPSATMPVWFWPEHLDLNSGTLAPLVREPSRRRRCDGHILNGVRTQGPKMVLVTDRVMLLGLMSFCWKWGHPCGVRLKSQDLLQSNIWSSWSR